MRARVQGNKTPINYKNLDYEIETAIYGVWQCEKSLDQL